jgi:predicted Rossmann fold flavoprotein
VSGRRIIVAGGGAAGFFAAIACAERNPDTDVLVLEKTVQFLAKVRISGGGRCNVTHACFDPGEFVTRYPRGSRELISPFRRFSARDTVAWFESRGVRLKTEPDGRMFPVTDTSSTIVECLTQGARAAGVRQRSRAAIQRVVRTAAGCFSVHLADGERLDCDRLLLATGGFRVPALAEIPQSLGHSVVPPVPSLFTFNLGLPWLRALAGVSVPEVEVAIPVAGLRERGPLLVTHWGVSGPVVLRLSAWGARALHARGHVFPMQINWLPQFTRDELVLQFQRRRETQGARLVANGPVAPLTARLWQALVAAAGIGREIRWASITRAQQQQLVRQLTCMDLQVSGKSLNKDEFVTCGGVQLREVSFKTMESRLCPGLYFAGEVLDIDGLTGGFNFQAAWTTGWIAGNSMAD